MRDILVESPFYKEIIARGLKQWREQGIEQGQITALRQAVIDVVQERFPALVESARAEVETINDATQLRRLVVKMSTVVRSEQAAQAFANLQQRH